MVSAVRRHAAVAYEAIRARVVGPVFCRSQNASRLHSSGRRALASARLPSDWTGRRQRFLVRCVVMRLPVAATWSIERSLHNGTRIVLLNGLRLQN